MIISNIILYVYLIILIILLFFLLYIIFATFSAAPYVPTSKKQIMKMLEMIDKPKTSTVLELGSGDGRIVVALAKQGFNTIGIEINPLLCLWSKILIKKNKLKNAKIINANFWDYNLKDIDILTMYFIPHRMKKLAKKIRKEMKPGSLIVSNAFKLADWTIDRQNGTVYVYIV